MPPPSPFQPWAAATFIDGDTPLAWVHCDSACRRPPLLLSSPRYLGWITWRLSHPIRNFNVFMIPSLFSSAIRYHSSFLNRSAMVKNPVGFPRFSMALFKYFFIFLIQRAWTSSTTICGFQIDVQFIFELCQHKSSTI